jgi:lipopolysaccharide transport system ATP-binding protein
MPDTIIRIEALGKKYTITHKPRERYTALRDVLTNKAKTLYRSLASPAGHKRSDIGTEEFWALKEVSFDVKHGEVVGIIGANGAGKSTLLKILSRITEPTTGRVRLKGRLASLLEVGTGFHPELTGRENIFLNGAILGMTRSEMKGKFDEIVAFAETEKFLDTPVKRYSSGMYVRLAFAVAAHLEPEILIIDEVLAVGDVQFQKKCLRKMEEVGKEGRTVLFVSHNMGAIRNLCGRVVWLHAGRTHQVGQTREVTENYLRNKLRGNSLDEVNHAIRLLPPDPNFKLEAITVRQKGQPGTSVLNGEPVEVEIAYTVFQQTDGLRVYFDLCDEEQDILVRTFNDDDANSASFIEAGKYISRALIPADLLAPRNYELRVYGTIYNVRSLTPGGVGIPLTVEKSNGINRAYPREPIRAKLLPKIHWETIHSNSSPGCIYGKATSQYAETPDNR